MHTQAPELELRIDGQVLLRVSVQLHTGLVLLSPGELIGGSHAAEPIASVSQVGSLSLSARRTFSALRASQVDGTQ